MSILKKSKKSLESILGVFSKAYQELSAWEEVSLEEQREIEARLKQNKLELEQARKAREALKAFINIK